MLLRKFVYINGSFLKQHEPLKPEIPRLEWLPGTSAGGG
jgi:hypothetical protein